jgi:hypothetical protein
VIGLWFESILDKHTNHFNSFLSILGFDEKSEPISNLSFPFSVYSEEIIEHGESISSLYLGGVVHGQKRFDFEIIFKQILVNLILFELL